MRIRTVLATLAAAGLATSSVAAAEARSSQPVESQSELGGGMSDLIWVAIILGLAVGMYFIAEDDNDDDSVSA